MSRRLDFLPEVQDDLDETYEWYEGRRTGLGDEYLAAVRAGLDRISANPYAHATIWRDVRRAIIRRFKTIVLYQPTEESVLIIAIVDGRGDPARWRSRVQD